jgi:hypothetical protein
MVRLSVRGWCPSSTAMTESPFAPLRRYLAGGGPVTRDLDWHYPTVDATTGSCARPHPSSFLWSSLGPEVSAGCCEPLLRCGPSRRYLCTSFPACLDPYPGGSCGAYTRFFPHDIGLPPVRNGSALHNNPFSDFRREPISRLQSFADVQARRFAYHPGRSYRYGVHRMAAVVSPSEPLVGRYLPTPRIC